MSLRARAIALLAQREHSVSELRRKLLRLAQLRDLQAWIQAQRPAVDDLEPGNGPASGHRVARPLGEPGRASVPPWQCGSRPVVSAPEQSRRDIGSFDLDEDWDDGEFEAFMEDWAQAEGMMPPVRAEAPPEQATSGAHAPAEQVPSGWLAPAATPGSRAQRRAQAGSLAGTPEGGRVDIRAEALADVRGDVRMDEAEARSASRRGPVRGGARGPDPSAEALSAVTGDERQQARMEEVEQLLQWLQQRGYLNESRLVESRINARAARYGNLRISQELKQLGVAPDEEQKARLKDSELERAREVWRRKFGGEAPVDAASRARQMRFLAARGFSSEVVRQVLRGDDD